MSISAATIQVRQASVADLEALAPLFDGYRQFYGKPSDIALARAFLLERFEHNQSVIFIAAQPNGIAVGFTQLYPTFSSVSAARTFILNDLFVATEARRGGVGIKLLQAAAQFGRSVGAVRLSLSTATDNETAQALYVSQGWVRDTKFYAYSLSL
ncbi:GNAT family N-acetyltransferase [Crenobacter cavernae]|uniref:GNAT family N-acetyltransferase n=1 Tax=Crenobacter cavernae TaxID=2290923 RepID=A0A345Y9R4_9NEIS|nr:GNAT family N-acetyltransferase [Crenobacter cavernae]AXK40666.1 GNAT family N-acetyltransferase [Crenobacter cavernae]